MTYSDSVTLLMMGIQTISIVIAGVFAYLAYRQTSNISKEQSIQTKKLHNEQKRIAEIQISEQKHLAEKQLELSKRQAYFNIYEHTKEIRDLKHGDGGYVVRDQAIFNANGMELIAIAWKLKIFDKQVLYEMYGVMFVDMYRQIQDAEKGIILEPILQNYPYITDLYNEWADVVDNLKKE